jgi:hypothetical protein
MVSLEISGLKKMPRAGCHSLITINLTTGEAEIKRITVRGQQKVS